MPDDLICDNVHTQIVISDQWMTQIKKVMGYPQVPKVLLSDEFIKEFCVWPTIHTYFEKFPIKTQASFVINGEVDIPFPNDKTYGVLDCRVVNKGLGGSSVGGSSFWDIVRYQTQNNGFGGRIGTTYGTSYNFNSLKQVTQLQQQMTNSLMNDTQTYKYFIDYEQRRLKAYSTISSELAVTWASWSYDWNSIRFTMQFEMIKLAQAHFLTHLADTGSIVDDSSSEKNINIGELKTRANDLLASFKEFWDAIPGVVLVRVA